MKFHFLKNLLISVLFLSLSSCEKNTEELSYQLNSFKLHTIDQYLPLDGLHAYSDGDSTFIAFCINKEDQIYIVSTSSPSKTHQRIQLKKNVINRDSFGNISSFAISNNKLAFFQLHRFGIYNLESNTIDYERPIEGTDSFPVYFVDYDIPIKYNSEKESLYLTIVSFINQEDKNYLFESPFYSIINPTDESLIIPPINYPPIFNDGELGYSGFVRTCIKGDSIITSFSPTNSISIYNSSSKKTSKINSRSKHYKAPKIIDVDSLDQPTRLRELRSQNFLYEDILYDKWKNCYYRVYSKSQELKNKEGLFNTYSDKEWGVLVMDEKLNLIGELDIPGSNARHFGVSQEGLFYAITDTSKNNTIDHLIIDIEI